MHKQKWCQSFQCCWKGKHVTGIFVPHQLFGLLTMYSLLYSLCIEVKIRQVYFPLPFGKHVKDHFFYISEAKFRSGRYKQCSPRFPVCIQGMHSYFKKQMICGIPRFIFIPNKSRFRYGLGYKINVMSIPRLLVDCGKSRKKT